MTTSTDFAHDVDELAQTITGYKNGKSGQAGQCDCIGLVMGALGKSFPMHSTNYFARKEMASLAPIGELTTGMLVYKARDGDINERYQLGGRYYTGDLLDYYHVGVVTSADPLEITHCTDVAGGIKRDTSTRGWTHAGWLKGITHGEQSEVIPMKTAYVKSTNGLPVRLRKKPDKGAETLAKVNVGTVVDVLEQAEEWATVALPDGKRGYMMSEFLNVLEYAQEPLAGLDEEKPDKLDRVIELLEAILVKLEGTAG